jgi:hypothetical protein
MQCKTFSQYFNANLKSLGLPIFDNSFNSSKTIIETVGVLAASLHTLGRGATVSELLGATVAIEKVAAAAGILASFYVGACIGSLFVASYKSNDCGRLTKPAVDRRGRRVRADEVVLWTKANKLDYPIVSNLLIRYPELYVDAPSMKHTFYKKAAA